VTHFSRRRFLSAAAGGLSAAALRPHLAFAAEKDDENPINAFGGDLFAKIKSDKGNVFVSPFSIETALAMTAAGAKGNTLDQMRKVLRLPDDADDRFQKLMAAINPAGAKRPYELATANAIWAQKGMPWRNEFKNRVAGPYASTFKEVDFRTDPDGARKECNEWVEKQTREKIKDILQSRDVRNDTRMLLANAIYFKGTWTDQFDKNATADAPFTKADGSKVTVPLMHRSGRYSYAEAGDVQAVSLPYKGNELSMLILLPKTPDGIGKLQDSLTGATLAEWAGKLKPEPTVRVYLPRFKAETRYDLGSTLIGMGMPDAFSDAKADFSGMQSGPEKLCIGFVIHKAFVDVNEEGTEAAAATVVGMRLTSAIQEKPKVFKADHPFLFAILHNPTKTALFLGRLSEPKAGDGR
jgi:serine protease inhibitor